MHLRSPHKLSSGFYINLDVYQTELRFGMVLSVGEIVTTILDLNTVNNSDRLGDVTAEPFKAPPLDSKKCPSAVTANWELSFLIDATRGGCMRL
jgi:hypothetical protein